VTLAVREKRIFETKSGGWGAAINTVFKVRGGEVCVDPIIKHKTASVAAIAKTLPTKLVRLVPFRDPETIRAALYWIASRISIESLTWL